MNRFLVGLVLCVSVALALSGQTVSETKRGPDPEFSFRTDSTLYHVRYADPFYSITIGYAFTNRGRSAVSSNYCRTPPSPILEKAIADGRWVRAYGEIALACKTTPPFRVAPGGNYHGTLHVGAARPDARIVPRFEVDSIPGTYRLRWELIAGGDPDLGRPVVQIVSTSFRLIGPMPDKQ